MTTEYQLRDTVDVLDESTRSQTQWAITMFLGISWQVISQRTHHLPVQTVSPAPPHAQSRPFLTQKCNTHGQLQSMLVTLNQEIGVKQFSEKVPDC